MLPNIDIKELLIAGPTVSAVVTAIVQVLKELLEASVLPDGSKMHDAVLKALPIILGVMIVDFAVWVVGVRPMVGVSHPMAAAMLIGAAGGILTGSGGIGLYKVITGAKSSALVATSNALISARLTAMGQHPPVVPVDVPVTPVKSIVVTEEEAPIPKTEG